LHRGAPVAITTRSYKAGLKNMFATPKVVLVLVAVATGALLANVVRTGSHSQALASIRNQRKLKIPGTTLELELLNEGRFPDAVCLDGTPGAVHSEIIDGATGWIIYFGGVGWCYSEEECLLRSKTKEGSSNNLSQVSEHDSTILSSDCNINPEFCKFSKVRLHYCDGFSFISDADEPVTVGNERIYFRGRKILDAVIATFIPRGLNNAEEILLTGHSAGGLATILNADYLSDRFFSNKRVFRSLKKYKALPFDGFFLNTNTVLNEPLFPMQIQALYNMSKAKGPNKCLVNVRLEEQWKCSFAENAYATLTTPMFLVNSVLDRVQLNQIYLQPLIRELHSLFLCTQDLEDCVNKDDVDLIQGYAQLFNTILERSSAKSRNKGTGFFYTCLGHMNSAFPYHWSELTIEGVAMRDAVTAWWRADPASPTELRKFMPCTLNKNEFPRQCNEMCNQEILHFS